MVKSLKNAAWLIAGAVVAAWAVTGLVGLVRAGPMEPPAAPGPTNRMAIFQPAPAGFPIIIDQPGSYYLAQDITGEAGKDGIQIDADDVTLDLNGFTLQGVPGSLDGVYVVGHGHRNISVLNGTVSRWGGDGVVASRSPDVASELGEFRDLRLHDNGQRGLATGYGSTVAGCTAYLNGGTGIETLGANVVSESVSWSNGSHGIVAHGDTRLSNCAANYNSGDGIQAGLDSVVSGCVATYNVSNGIATGARSIITGNTATGNHGAGVYVDDIEARIEGNNVAENGVGIDVDHSGNIIIKNSASGNTTDYDIVAGNTYGQIVDMTAGGAITADPWANFRY
jgi:parallel beta-helix repeat protein